MILITTPGFREFDALNRQTASRSRADGDGHNCVPNKDRADFPPVLESDHTIAVVQGLSAQYRACRVSQAADSLARATTRMLLSYFLGSQRQIRRARTLAPTGR